MKRNMTNNNFKDMTIFKWLLICIGKNDYCNTKTYSYIKQQNFKTATRKYRRVFYKLQMGKDILNKTFHKKQNKNKPKKKPE